jgi:lysyl-tRNA synthetase class 1
LAAALADSSWEDDALQSTVFEVARMTPIEQPVAFKAIYRVLLDKEAGPKAGNLFAYLDRDFVRRRLVELPFDRETFWQESAISQDDLAKWMTQQREKIASCTHELHCSASGNFLELIVQMKDGKRHLRRVRLEATPDVNAVLGAFA